MSFSSIYSVGLRKASTQPTVDYYYSIPHVKYARIIAIANHLNN